MSYVPVPQGIAGSKKQSGLHQRLSKFDLERRATDWSLSSDFIRLVKIGLPLFIVGLAGMAITTLWRYEILLLMILCALALLKHLLLPIPWELPWFGALAVMGAYAESMIIQGGGAWYYASPQLVGIPIWLPGIWGLCGICIVTSYWGLANLQLSRQDRNAP
jgi:hypothetical protein